jgi:hypothetical protein
LINDLARAIWRWTEKMLLELILMLPLHEFGEFAICNCLSIWRWTEKNAA